MLKGLINYDIQVSKYSSALFRIINFKSPKKVNLVASNAPNPCIQSILDYLIKNNVQDYCHIANIITDMYDIESK